jgi:hypothetical protein
VQLDMRSLLLGFLAGLVVIVAVVFYLIHLFVGSSDEGHDDSFERLECLEALLESEQRSPSNAGYPQNYVEDDKAQAVTAG